jgi:hypothetical protein
MTHPGDAELDALLEGLDDVTPYEREALREVLDEVDGGGWGSRPGPGPYGPGPGTLEETGAALDDAYGGEAARLAEDEADRAALAKRPNDEHKLARALDRIGDGTYTPAAYFRPAREPTGRWGYPCGPADDFGGCAARYHQPGCVTVMVTDGGHGSYEDAEAWNAVVRKHLPPPGSELGLATDYGEVLDDWAGLPAAADPGLHARVLALMGEADAPPLPRPVGPAPDVSGLIEELGLR